MLQQKENITNLILTNLTLDNLLTFPPVVRPSFEVPLKSQIVKLGETAVFNCEISGEPEPTVEWLAVNEYSSSSDNNNNNSNNNNNNNNNDDFINNINNFNDLAISRSTFH